MLNGVVLLSKVTLAIKNTLHSLVIGKIPMFYPNKSMLSLVESLLTRYRGIFAVVFLLPLSCIYGIYRRFRDWIVFIIRSAPAQHEERVQEVIDQINNWHCDGTKEPLCTARSGWHTMSEMVPKYKLTHRPISLKMYDILEIDTLRCVVRVEPLVTMGQLSRFLIAKGWVLPVVPELDDLTVGGLIMGFGVETSSHKYGLFQSICESFEVITAEGKRVICSKEENSEWYYLIPWSHGTLGFLTSAEIRIIPAKKYVRIDYQPVFSTEDIVTVFERESRKTTENDFVEGLVFSQETAVILRGVLTDEVEPNIPINRIHLWYKPWFYKLVEDKLRSSNTTSEYIPLREYLHRHTRSYFWTMESIIPFGNHPVFRALLGWALPPRIDLLKYTETETTRSLREQYHVVQDMLMPIRYLREALNYFDIHFELYPLWLCPMSVYTNTSSLGFIHPYTDTEGNTDELYVDIGAYGIPRKKGFDGRSALPLLEKFVIEHRGFQALYAKTTLGREDFRSMFDHTGYDLLRQTLPYCTKAFPEVYDKVSCLGRISPVEMRKLARTTKISS